MLIFCFLMLTKIIYTKSSNNYMNGKGLFQLLRVFLDCSQSSRSGSYRYGQPSWFLMYRGDGIFLAVGLGLDTNIRIFLKIFRRFWVVRGGEKNCLFDREKVSNVHVCLFYFEQCPCELYYTKSLFRNWVRDVCKHAGVWYVFYLKRSWLISEW